MTIYEILNRELTGIGINYSYMEAVSPSYPYFTGEISETDFSYEENRTQGTILLEGWTRNTWSELLEKVELIKQHFADYQTVEDDSAFYVGYTNNLAVRSGEAELKKIQVFLDFKTWKPDY